VHRLAVLGVLLLLAGCSTAPPYPSGNGSLDTNPDQPLGPGINLTKPRKFVHEHAGFALFVLGERVPFNATDYDLQARGNISAHLHVTEKDGGAVLHLEGFFPDGIPDITVAQFLAIHGVSYKGASLTLDTLDGHNGTTWNSTLERAWQLWVQRPERAWEQAPEGPGWFLRDGQRVLLTYAPANATQLQAQQDEVPSPPVRQRSGPA
jgi:hypothetical protein